MTPTSDERREVAARLRQASHTDANLDVTIAIAILETIGEVHRPIAAVVADLIDPTCHVVTSGERRGRPIGSACSVCHAPLYPSTAWAHGMRYCSQCGHRVVDDGD